MSVSRCCIVKINVALNLKTGKCGSTKADLAVISLSEVSQDLILSCVSRLHEATAGLVQERSANRSLILPTPPSCLNPRRVITSSP